jgi:2-oxoisovalerate dehydrogenase E1 component
VYDAAHSAGKVLVLHEDNLTGGIGGELTARIQEVCFEHLDAPVKRVASLDTPVPFAANLEDDYLAKADLSSALDSLLSY